jgi:hypothetical protein
LGLLELRAQDVGLNRIIRISLLEKVRFKQLKEVKELRKL